MSAFEGWGSMFVGKYENFHLNHWNIKCWAWLHHIDSSIGVGRTDMWVQEVF